MLLIDRKLGESIFIGDTKVTLISAYKDDNIVYIDIEGKRIPVSKNNINIENSILSVISISEYKNFQQKQIKEVRFGFNGSDVIDREEVRNDPNYRGKAK